VLTRRVVHIEPDDELPVAYHIPDTPETDREALVSAPLIAGDRVLGALTVWREGPTASFTPEDADLIRRFATLAALAYENARQREQLQAQARTDPLTGLANRRHFVERLDAEMARTGRGDVSVGLVLLDIDDFKRVNDGLGHQAGDAVLCDYGRVLLSSVRPFDVVCRTGGEEFAVILPGTGPAEVAHLADRLVHAVRGTALGPDVTVTTSAGYATAPRDASTGTALFKVADDRLLAAKAAGKDTVGDASPA
jgi:diguanylate cyclase (GGDEF)-like protein